MTAAGAPGEPSPNSRDTGGLDAPALPLPKIKRMWWPFPLIWIVPIGAAALAGYFVYEHHREQGKEITIRFDEVAGVRPGDTTIAVRGVTVGRVRSVELSADHHHVLAHCRLTLENESIARQGTVFWLVRPEISLESVSALSTVVSGPYIEAQPGDGPPATTFDGLAQAPVAAKPGLDLVLRAERVGPMNAESPVTYRGIQVGVVQSVGLAPDATTADVRVHIWKRYAGLVRSNSEFWMVKGADIEGGLFSGVKVQVNSLRTLLSGGIAFATPEKNPGPLVAPGAQFLLNEQAQDQWLKWRPKLALPAAAEHSPAQSPAAQPQKNMLPSLRQD